MRGGGGNSPHSLESQSDSESTPAIASRKDKGADSKDSKAESTSKGHSSILREKCGLQEKGRGSYLEGNDRSTFSPLPHLSPKDECQSIVLDFFAGSGTTLATAQKLNRKWLGVEMGEHFYKVIIPRLKKVIAGFQSGISKECGYKGGGAFRYYELESYEEALKECEYMLEDRLESSRDISPQAQYDKAGDSMDYHDSARAESRNDKKAGDCHALHCKAHNDKQARAKDYIKAQKIIDYRKSRKLIKTLNKSEKITLDMSGYREDFDIFHTLANLQGLRIKRLFLDSNNIESCEFDNGSVVSKEQIDLHTYPKLKNLIWWE